MADETTAGPAPAGHCPRCGLPREPELNDACNAEGWPCFDPFHDGFAEGHRERLAVAREAYEKRRKALPPTPELDKMAKAREDGSETIGAFLEWLQSQGLTLCTWFGADMREQGWRPDSRGIQRLLADYFGVDLVKVDAERMEILKHLRGQQ